MPTPKNLSILEKFAVTWGEHEAAILAFAACGLDFAIRGSHGNAKTITCTLIARALGKSMSSNKDQDLATILPDELGGAKVTIPVTDGVRVVYADKASIMSLAGLPDLEQSRKLGDLTFIKSKKSLIGDVQVILIDELTRAPKETQNHLLEVIESKTLLGHQLTHKVVIAAFNPDTYKGAVKLDAALLDRFIAVIPVSDFSDIDSDQIDKMIDINMRKETDNDALHNQVRDELRAAFAKIRAKYDGYLKNQDMLDKVRAYLTSFISMAQPKIKQLDEKNILSGREIGRHMFRALLAITAYYEGICGYTEGQSLEAASNDALNLCLITKHAFTGGIVQQLQTIQADTKYMLRATGKGPAGKLQFAFAKALSLPAQVQFWRDNAKEVIKLLDTEQQMEMMEHTLNKVVAEERQITNEKDKAKVKAARQGVLKTKVELFNITNAHKEFESVTDRTEGAILCDVVFALQSAGVDYSKDPYKTMFMKGQTETNDLVDIVVSLSDKGI